MLVNVSIGILEGNCGVSYSSVLSVTTVQVNLQSFEAMLF